MSITEEDKYNQIKTALNYHKLLASGLFFEFYPELCGTWEKDLIVICPDAKLIEDLSYKNNNTDDSNNKYKSKLINECPKCGSMGTNFDYMRNYSEKNKLDKILVCFNCGNKHKLTDSEVKEYYDKK
jgi:hypothetical protein